MKFDGERIPRISLWRRMRWQWRLQYARIAARYESLYLECRRILELERALKLRSIFFGVFEEDPTGTLIDTSGRRYRYLHISVAVTSFHEEFLARRVAGYGQMSEIRGDLPGSMAYDCFYRNEQLPYFRVTEPEAMDQYVVQSLELQNFSPERRTFLKSLLYRFCGRNLGSIGRLLRRLNGANLFHTVEIRDTDPYQELNRGSYTRRIGLIMFVSRRADLTPEELEPAVQRLKRLFYDAHLMRRQAREVLQIGDEIFLSLVNILPLGHVVHDLRRVLYVNPRALELLGAASIEELNSRPLLEFIHPTHRANYQERIRGLFAAPTGTTLPANEERLLRMDGSELPAETACARVNYFGASAIQLVFTDLTARRRMEEERERNRLYDALTGLPNRLLFLDRLNQVIAQESGRSHHKLIGVLYIDIDDFRAINDAFQYEGGDAILKGIVARFKEVAPVHLARLTGDKFGLLLPDLESTEQAIFFTEGLQDLFRLKPLEWAGTRVAVNFSAGLTFYPLDGKNADELLSRCEVAVSRAKETNNRLQLYNAAMNRRTAALFATGQQLIRAIENREFMVYYQPQIDTRRGAVTGVEALVRWRHPERGLVLPSEFITIAEERGLILEIGEWVLEEACRYIKLLHGRGFPDLEVAVNLAPRQLEQSDLVTMVRGALARTEFPPDRLVLEVVERGIVQENEAVLRSMRALTRMGVRFQVDDFGTGHAAITYLKDFPVGAIKIDRSFLENMERDGSLVRGLLAFAEKLGLQAIVEGVEREDQLRFFEGLGARYFQGFYFSGPLPPEDLERYLRVFPVQHAPR